MQSNRQKDIHGAAFQLSAILPGCIEDSKVKGALTPHLACGNPDCSKVLALAERVVLLLEDGAYHLRHPKCCASSDRRAVQRDVTTDDLRRVFEIPPSSKTRKKKGGKPGGSRRPVQLSVH